MEFIKEYAGVLAALGQLAVATSVAYIAWKSYTLNKAGFYINRDHLRLTLFDRRLKVFEAFRDLLVGFVLEGSVSAEKLSTFILGTSEAEFIFGKEIYKYRREVIDKCVYLRQLQRRLEQENITPDERKKLSEKMEIQEKWLSNQEDQLSDKFRKYLHFSIESNPK
jgi:hypothetical protein